MFEIANDPEIPTSVDVVAVHGLQGHAFKTWTFDNGNMWLRDELPGNVPAARVLTFGYDSTIAFSRSVATIEDIALQLLTALHMERESDEALGTRRPIVFVCHSLGGIVVKKALVLANERSSDVGFKDILDNTRAIAFLAVPHRGSATADWMQILAYTLKAGSLGTTTNKAVLEGLRKNSPMLRDISKQFVERGKDLQIYTFYELEKIAGMPSRVSTLLHWRTLRVVILVPGCR
jgi:triacylglycerol esterase/lipase EstA (alpha/beta hydrolase family)